MHPSYFPVFLWSIVIFVSFLGYGEALRRALRRPEFDDLGWGLTAAWGMAVTLAIGGFLMAIRLAVAPFLAVVVMTGTVLAFFHATKQIMAAPDSLRLPRVNLADSILYGLAGIAFASSIAWPHQIDPNDDLICYLMLPVKLLATGTLIEPFSFQRAGTYGGQHLLQALVMTVGGERSGHIPDLGFGRVLCFGIVWNILRRRGTGSDCLGFALVFLMLVMPVPKINTASSLTGSAMLLAVYETMRRICDRRTGQAATPWSSLIPVALLVAGASVLRPMWLIAAFAFVGLHFLSSMWAAKKDISTTLVLAYEGFTCVAGALAILVPWGVVLFLSNATVMNPPFPGNVNPAFLNMSTREGLFADVAHALGFMVTAEPAVLIIPLVASIVSPCDRIVRAVAVSVLLAVFLVAERCAVAILSEVYRYTFPILFSGSFFTLATRVPRCAAIEAPATPWICVALMAIVNFVPGMNLLREQLVSIPIESRLRESFLQAEVEKAYSHLQDLVPAGEKILAVVDAPYLFDFRRNTIDTINAIGGAGPYPGLPFQKGPEPLRRYLLDHGYRYVIAVDFNNAVLLYTRRLWQEHKRPEWFWKEVWARHALDFMDNVDEVAKGRRTIASAANARLIDMKGTP